MCSMLGYIWSERLQFWETVQDWYKLCDCNSWTVDVWQAEVDNGQDGVCPEAYWTFMYQDHLAWLTGTTDNHMQVRT